MDDAAGRRFGVRFPIGAKAWVGATGAAAHEKPPDWQRAMTDAACLPLGTVRPIAEREQLPDRFVELLECMADLLVETRRQRAEIARHRGSDDPRVRGAIARLSEFERSLEGVGAEAASVHQVLQHVHLI
jgi:hypothetical protein